MKSDWFWYALCLVFVVLKLTHVIDWSWWYVTAPIWGWYAFGLVMLIFTLLIAYVERRL